MRYQDIDPKEYIRVTSWEKACKEIGGAEFVPNEHIFEHFSSANHPHSVVSAYSDFSVRSQQQNHPNADLHKYSVRMQWPEAMRNRTGYSQMQIGPCCDKKKCDPFHSFSIKIDSWTMSTFDKIPENITSWWCANLDARIPGAHWIPFGLNDHGPGIDLLPNHVGKEKKHLLYVNFQDNTLERMELKRWYKERCPWATFRNSADIPIDQFLDEIASHKFVLSPFGNGLDCYRNYEAMYLGSVPIVPQSVFSQNMLDAGFKAIACSNMFGITKEQLDPYWEKVVNLPVSNTMLFSTWSKAVYSHA